MPKKASSKKQKFDTENAIAVWDFNIHLPDDGFCSKTFKQKLKKLFKAYTFQLEIAPDAKDRIGYHWQGRGSLWKRKRKSELLALINVVEELRGLEISPTVTDNIKGDTFYYLKEDTKAVDHPDVGPHTDKDMEVYIPRQYRGMLENMYPWQETVIASRNDFNFRKVDVIIDPGGNSGKSTVASLARLHYGCLDLPMVSDHKELIQVVCDVLMAKEERDPGIVFIDCPRSLDQKRLGPYMIAVEQIKKGYVADTRYSFREWDFDSPRVWLFVNHEMDMSYLSADRFNLWRICPQLKILKPWEAVAPIFNPPTHPVGLPQFED